MDIIGEVDALRRSHGSKLCVLAETSDKELIEAAADQMDLTWPLETQSPRRPSVVVTDEQVNLMLMVLGADRQQFPLQIFSRGRGMLAVGAPAALEAVRPIIAALRPEDHSGDHWEPVTATIMAVARRCEEVLGELDDYCEELAVEAIGYTSSAQRRAIGGVRSDLFRIGEMQAAQQNLLSPEGELAETLGDLHERRLARAARAFDANQSMATRLYAMLGDVLNEQDTLVSERLTLVATIFLPLTLATGFFGMNFQWMTDRIGGFLAFLILGIIVPVVLAVVTLILIRRMSRQSQP